MTYHGEDPLALLAQMLPTELATNYEDVLRRSVESNLEFWNSRLTTAELAALLGKSPGTLRNNRNMVAKGEAEPIGVGWDDTTQTYDGRHAQLIAIRKRAARAAAKRVA